MTFHNGNPFNADDVLFSFDRIRTEGSDMKTRVVGVEKAVKVDDYTVDFITRTQPHYPLRMGDICHHGQGVV